MKTVGIVAEYNPLHNGHLYHMEMAKKLSKADNCIVTLSGNFVQRGEPAICHKAIRSEWAIKAGADIVLETPVIYSVSNAEQFAFGSIHNLLNTGVVTHIAFGCENNDLSLLEKACSILDSENDDFKEKIRFHLKNGESYPRARYSALADMKIDENVLDVISKPNNILALEYLRAIKKINPEVIPVPIIRSFDNHNSNKLEFEHPSSTAIRSNLSNNNFCMSEFVPDYVSDFLLDKNNVLSYDDFSNIIFYSLLKLTSDEIEKLVDVSEGFENVLYKAIRSTSSLDSLLSTVKSKRYTLSRCKRILIYALLGIKKDDFNKDYFPEFIRPLAIKNKDLLSDIRKLNKTNILIKKEDYNLLSDTDKKLCNLDNFSNEVYGSVMKKDFRKNYQGPIFY